MSKLYEINNDLALLLAEAEGFDETTTAEMIDDWRARYLESKEEQEDKLESIMIVRQESLLRVESLKKEMERLQKQAESDESVARRMEDMLSFFMQNEGRTEIKTPRFTAKFKKNPPSMMMDPEFESSMLEKFGVPEASEELKRRKDQFGEWKSGLKKAAVDLVKSGELPPAGVTITQAERLVIS